MAKKLKFRILAEWNRDGKLEKVGTERYDPEKVSVVAIHEQEQYFNEEGKRKWKSPVKKYEHIFTDDQEPDDTGREPKILLDDEDGLYQVEPGQDLAINAVITDPDGNDTIKEITWLQTFGTACPFEVVPDSNNKSIVIHPSVEGDYAFSVTAVDNTDKVATKIANVQVREKIPICPPGQHPGPDGKCVPDEPTPEEKWIPVVAGFGDSNSNSRSSTTFNNINKLECDVSALGDYEYDSNFDEFKSIYILREKTKIADKGNHDDTESESAAIAAANKAYWGWQDPATGKAKVGNIGLIAIDTQANAADQKQFVEAALLDFQSDPDVLFIVATSHKPFYCPKTKHGEESEFRNLFQPLFDKYGVDAVWHGHNHINAISYPMVTGKLGKYQKNAKGEYDFSKVHGQIYVISGNAGESLYQIDSNPDYIQWSDDNNYGFVVLQQSQQNTKRFRILFMSNEGKELHSVIIDKTGEQEPPIEGKPVIDVGENGNVSGNVNQEVSISVSATDPTKNNEAIHDIQWFITQSQDPTLTFLLSEDNWVLTFQTAIAGVYKFNAVAKGSTGMTAEATLTVTIREEEVPDEDGLQLVYDSDRDIAWDDIQAILEQNNAGLKDTEKLDYVRYDNIYGDQSKVDSGYIRTNASGNPRLLLFPATKEICLEHDGKYGRLYFGKRNYNSKLVCKLKYDSCDNGFSAKLRNRHQFRQYCREVLGYTKEEADKIAIELVQGGQGLGLRCGEYDNDLEIEHDTGEVSGPNGTFSPKLESGKYHDLEFSVYDKDGKIHVIDIVNGKKIGEGDVKAPSQFFKQELFNEWSEFWIRYNTAEKPNQRLFVKQVKLYKYTKLP